MGIARVKAQGKKLGNQSLPKEKVDYILDLRKRYSKHEMPNFEIAKLAGVSRAVVSRILSGKYQYFSVENNKIVQSPIPAPCKDNDLE